MSNPNLNFSMMSNDTLVTYRDSLAAQVEQLNHFKRDTAQELGHRGLLLVDLNQGFSGELHLHHMTNEEVQEYAGNLVARAEDAYAKLDAANQELGQRYEQGRAA